MRFVSFSEIVGTPDHGIYQDPYDPPLSELVPLTLFRRPPLQAYECASDQVERVDHDKYT